MNQNTQLELSFEEFEGIVRTLLENPCLETASNANLGSLKLTEDVFYEMEFNGRVSPEEMRTYTELMGSCVVKFKDITPRALDVELWREQMQGRINSVSKFYYAKRLNYN